MGHGFAVEEAGDSVLIFWCFLLGGAVRQRYMACVTLLMKASTLGSSLAQEKVRWACSQTHSLQTALASIWVSVRHA